MLHNLCKRELTFGLKLLRMIVLIVVLFVAPVDLGAWKTVEIRGIGAVMRMSTGAVLSMPWLVTIVKGMVGVGASVWMEGFEASVRAMVSAVAWMHRMLGVHVAVMVRRVLI